MKKHIKVSDIIITDDFKASVPSIHKIDRCRKFFKKNKKIDKKILLDSDNRLLDGYIRYLVLVENNVEYTTVNVLNENYYGNETFYVFGRHPCSVKEYVWRLPPEKLDDKNKYHIGKKVLVKTKRGTKVIEITRTLLTSTPPAKSYIRKVIRLLDK